MHAYLKLYFTHSPGCGVKSPGYINYDVGL